MGRFEPGRHGPLLAVDLNALWDGGAHYRARLEDQGRWLNLRLDYVAPTKAQHEAAPGLARVERWTLEESGFDLWRDVDLDQVIRREVEASAARLGFAVLTEIATDER